MPDSAAHPVSDGTDVTGEPGSGLRPWRRLFSSGQTQLLFVGTYVLAAAVAAPFASVVLHRTQAFLPAQLAAVLVEALLTALLLFQRFRLRGGLRLAGLASAYLLHAMFAVA
ncbi:MAG: hypothetical protein ACYDHU_03840, partial [Acidimicrobiales bacterium]